MWASRSSRLTSFSVRFFVSLKFSVTKHCHYPNKDVNTLAPISAIAFAEFSFLIKRKLIYLRQCHSPQQHEMKMWKTSFSPFHTETRRYRFIIQFVVTPNSWSEKWCESDNNINDVSHSNLSIKFYESRHDFRRSFCMKLMRLRPFIAIASLYLYSWRFVLPRLVIGHGWMSHEWWSSIVFAHFHSEHTCLTTWRLSSYTFSRIFSFCCWRRSVLDCNAIHKWKHNMELNLLCNLAEFNSI